MNWGRLCLAACLLLLLQCVPSLTRFYPGSYFEQDRTYVNKPLGFSMVFTGNWHISCEPEGMRGASRDLAQSLAKSGAELLFMGSTAEGTQGVRAIVINLNSSNQAYAEKIRELNKNDVQRDSGFVDFPATSIPCVKWRYAITGFEFVEYFFKLDTYNMRIAFWAKPDLFFSFLPVYDKIVSTLSFESHY
jgi:hypothetical protein